MTKGKGVCLGERAARLGLQVPPDVQDRSSTSLEEMEELGLLEEQELRGQSEKREIKEMLVLQDMPPRVRRASLGSSWDQTGNPCTWAVWQEDRGIQALQDPQGLQVQPVLMDRKERLVSQVGRVVLV